jgi:hypothetical protein
MIEGIDVAHPGVPSLYLICQGKDPRQTSLQQPCEDFKSTDIDRRIVNDAFTHTLKLISAADHAIQTILVAVLL